MHPRVLTAGPHLAAALTAILLGCPGCGGGSGDDNPTPAGIAAYSRLVTDADIEAEGTGAIAGTVRDAAGDPRSSVTVSLLSAGTQSQAAVRPAAALSSARTNAQGQYGFANVPAGNCRLRCTGEADQTVPIEAGQVAQADFGGNEEPGPVHAITVWPLVATIAVGGTRSFTAAATDAEGNELPDVAFDWSSSAPGVATVDGSGVARGVAEGEARIQAAAGSVQGGATLHVEAETPTDLTNLFFLHHSTGQGIIGGGVREAVAAYDGAHGTHFEFWDHGYNGDGLTDAAGNATGISYDIPDDNTDPDGLYRLWCGTDAEAAAARNAILEHHGVIAFKSCFPASAIADAATLHQYQDWYLAMRSVFDEHQDHVFVVMSTPPLHRHATNRTEATNARAFANWLKSSAYLSGYPNVRCFDLFGLLAEPDDGTATANMLRYEYEGDHNGDDSHPNALANETVAPLLAEALIEAAQ